MATLAIFAGQKAPQNACWGAPQQAGLWDKVSQNPGAMRLLSRPVAVAPGPYCFLVCAAKETLTAFIKNRNKP